MVTRIKKSESVAVMQNAIKHIPEDVFNTGRRARGRKDITQKKAVETFIPYLFVLRGKGCSWTQITNLLNDKCGFKLQPSTMRSYFGEMVPKHVDICRNAMAEHLLTMAEIKKQEKLADMPDAFRTVVAVMDKQRRLAEPKIAEIFGLGK